MPEQVIAGLLVDSLDLERRRSRLPSPVKLRLVRFTRVALSAAHLDHDPTNNRPGNLKSLCQRCHLQHDRPHHAAQRRLTVRLRWAMGDLFEGRHDARTP